MAVNAGCPSPSDRNSYIPPPQAVSYSIFGIFILEDQLIVFHPKTPSCPHWSVTFSGHSHHGWLLGTLITSLIGTPTPRRGWATRRVSKKLGSSLSSMPYTTSASTLGMSASLFKHMITNVTISHFPFGGLFFQALHSLFYVVCCGWSQCCLFHSPGASWTPWP